MKTVKSIFFTEDNPHYPSFELEDGTVIFPIWKWDGHIKWCSESEIAQIKIDQEKQKAEKSKKNKSILDHYRYLISKL